MAKKTIAVLFGGCSTEYSVSLESAYAVLTNLNTETYDIIPIGITREGDWYRYLGSYEKLTDNTWMNADNELIPVVVSPNRSVRGILEFLPEHAAESQSAAFDSRSGIPTASASDSRRGAPAASASDSHSGAPTASASPSAPDPADGHTSRKVRVTPIDLAFPVLHGKCGEDGTVQGVFELAGIPVIGCDTLSSALCMDKERAHRLVCAAGIAVPKAVAIRDYEAGDALSLTAHLTYPLFVKPVRAGSSYGISKISSPEELDTAVSLALGHDSEVIVEENIEGFEVGCAVIGISELFVGRVDEVSLAQGFFDYAEKYERSTAVIHMPARIDPDTELRIQDTAKQIYRALGCSGFARVDMFLTPDGSIVFNEVNSIPGLTAMSRFPTMMKGAGLSFPEMLDKLTGLYDK